MKHVLVEDRRLVLNRTLVVNPGLVPNRTLVMNPGLGVHRRPGVRSMSAVILGTILASCSSHGAATAPSRSAAPPSAAASAPAAGSAPAAPSADSIAQAGERVVHVTAKKFEYSPSEIHLKKGEPVVLEFVSLDRKHGFEAPDLGLSTEIDPKAPSRLRFVPQKEGRFPFHCSVFCGDGHEDMTGEIVVEP